MTPYLYKLDANFVINSIYYIAIGKQMFYKFILQTNRGELRAYYIIDFTANTPVEKFVIFPWTNGQTQTSSTIITQSQSQKGSTQIQGASAQGQISTSVSTSANTNTVAVPKPSSYETQYTE